MTNAILNFQDSQDYQCKTICLTGGPCGGKSSCMSILSDIFENLGWKVYRVPETATILLNGGIVFADLASEQSYSFQKSILRTMLAIEQTYRDLAQINASQGIKTVVICDRGAMDPSAYMERELWLKMVNELGTNESALRDHRYDAVVHLVTAAEGAEEHYTTANNNIRSEGLQLARELDAKAMKAWMGHAYFDIIGNETDFKGKCNRVIECVLNRLGLADIRFGKNIHKHKYIVHTESPFDVKFPEPFMDFKVEHIYLKQTDSIEVRIRRREQLASTNCSLSTSSSSVHYTLTAKCLNKDGSTFERRRNLTGREYEELKLQRDPSRIAIVKRRRTFFSNNHYFQMDKFENDSSNGLVLLEAYLDHPTSNYRQFSSQSGTSEPVTPVGKKEHGQWLQHLLPEWLELEEVTGKQEYSLYNLAKLSC